MWLGKCIKNKSLPGTNASVKWASCGVWLRDVKPTLETVTVSISVKFSKYRFGVDHIWCLIIPMNICELWYSCTAWNDPMQWKFVIFLSSPMKIVPLLQILAFSSLANLVSVHKGFPHLLGNAELDCNGLTTFGLTESCWCGACWINFFPCNIWDIIQGTETLQAFRHIFGPRR